MKKQRRRNIVVFILLAGLCLAVTTAGRFLWKNHKETVISYSENKNFNTKDYLPFSENSKIVRLVDKPTLRLKKNLPVLDGAAALFPVYSAVINAVYPSGTRLKEVDDKNCAFVYNNTVEGYYYLLYGETDIFFGVCPSEDQLAAFKEEGKECKLTPIGREAFIFFVNKDNPVDNLTQRQIKDIYSGKITNWKQAGGKDEKITAYQRNEDSGSQTAFLRFMKDEVVMEPPTHQVEDLMSGMIEEVAKYKNNTKSIGFSFRYYTEEMIANPQVKILSVDGIKPSKETIRDGSYPLGVSIYAATLKSNRKKNVKKLVDWMLSEQGQYIVEKTGYVGVK